MSDPFEGPMQSVSHWGMFVVKPPVREIEKYQYLKYQKPPEIMELQ